MADKVNLLQKYNVQGPRYTSYPTVPYWQNSPTKDQWIQHLKTELKKNSDAGHGAAIYLHIPFCEQLCTFCACNKVITQKHERAIPYIKAIHQEWDIYKQQLRIEKIPVTEIHLGGGTPTFLDPQQLKDLLQPLLQDFDLLPGAELSFEADPRVTTADQLQILYDLGFRRLSLGVQDYDAKVQEAINRIQSPTMVGQLTEIARSIGYTSVNYDLVYGLPFQTLAGIHETIQHVIADKPDRIAFYAYAHVPWVGKTGQRKFSDVDLPSGDVKRQLYEQGRAMLESAGYQEVGMDHFALPSDKLFKAVNNKTLFRNFMGYMPMHVSPMIGLGCSAISDSWTCFMQNEKDLKKYEQLVGEGELPLMRGHILSDEDLIMRQHILNLMTRFETSWQVSDAFTSYLMEVPNYLQEAINDNLIELVDNKIKIKANGRPFVRNICMAFDARLQRQAPNTQIFSKTI